MPRWLVMFSGLEEATVTLSHHLLFGGLTAFAFVFAGAQTAPAKRAKTAMVFFGGASSCSTCSCCCRAG